MSIDRPSDCPFCVRIATGDVTGESEHAVAFPDAYPVTPGHMLVVPRRHEADFFALSDSERTEMLTLAVRIRKDLADSGVTGFNLGINAGADAGQTVDHAHLHLIPRYAGDVDDPRGGVRWVIPDKAAYWER